MAPTHSKNPHSTVSSQETPQFCV